MRGNPHKLKYCISRQGSLGPVFIGLVYAGAQKASMYVGYFMPQLEVSYLQVRSPCVVISLGPAVRKTSFSFKSSLFAKFVCIRHIS